MDFIAIDFEASCLPRHGRSYPIEVGISGADGARSWLIKPDPLWRNWDWTDEAARLHGLSKEMLDREGVAPHVVWAQLAAATAGKRVFADGYLDMGWWRALSAAAQGSIVCPIEHASIFLDEVGASAADIEAAMRFADGHCPERHRAAPDADWLWQALMELNRLKAGQTILRRAA